MRKMYGILLVGLMLALPFAANANVGYMTGVNQNKEPLVSMLLSAGLPGVGEWYNSDWEGSFPWGECIIGNICCLFQISSVLDAVNGNTDKDMRLDFWTPPVKN